MGLLHDASAGIRSAALERFAEAAPEAAIEPALDALRDPEPEVRAAAGRALGAAADVAMDVVLGALEDPQTADAAVEAIRGSRAASHQEGIRAFVEAATAHAMHDGELAAVIPADSPAKALLRDAVLDRGRRTARSALWALTLLAPDRGAMEAGIDNLEGADPAHLANALETLEVAGVHELVRPLLTLWEPGTGRSIPNGRDWLREALEEDDQFIRRCAELVRAEDKGDQMPTSRSALSPMERLLFLRQVSLFAGLSPVDLERVGSIAEESGYADGEVIAAEGEFGEELHIVMSGAIRVVQDRAGSEYELARRTAGDVVGEMSIISRKPRIASLIAEGDVRTIRLAQREFESILRERPSVALAVIGVLAQRLTEQTGQGIET